MVFVVYATASVRLYSVLHFIYLMLISVIRQRNHCRRRRQQHSIQIQQRS